MKLLIVFDGQSLDFLRILSKLDDTKYSQIILISENKFSVDEIRSILLKVISSNPKILAIFRENFDLITDFYKYLTSIVDNDDVDVIFSGKATPMHFFLAFTMSYNLLRVRHFLFLGEGNRLAKIKGSIGISIEKFLDPDDKLVIQMLDFLSTTKRKDILDYISRQNKTSRAKVDKSLNKLVELNLIQRVSMGEYKLTELGLLVKLAIST
jgi:predicted transcriptional regulator